MDRTQIRAPCIQRPRIAQVRDPRQAKFLLQALANAEARVGRQRRDHCIELLLLRQLHRALTGGVHPFVGVDMQPQFATHTHRERHASRLSHSFDAAIPVRKRGVVMRRVLTSLIFGDRQNHRFDAVLGQILAELREALGAGTALWREVVGNNQNAHQLSPRTATDSPSACARQFAS